VRRNYRWGYGAIESNSKSGAVRLAWPYRYPRAELSAVICTRDRTVSLERALRSLIDQRMPPAEILVIDNAPADDSTQRLVEARFPDVSYVRDPTPGLDSARNRALREARSEIVAFLDDDAVADRDWTHQIVDTLAGAPHAAACTGRVEPLSLETPAQRLFEANGGLHSPGDERIRLPHDRIRRRRGLPQPLIARGVSIGSGCNSAVRRSIALEIGGFDEALDLGPRLAGGGDIDMFWRLLARGHEIIYEPRAVVRHEHRRSLEEAYTQIAEHQRALIAVLTKAMATSPGRFRPWVATFLAWRLAKPGMRLLRRLLRRDPVPAAVLIRIWGATLSGLVAYRPARRAGDTKR
jgi:GT2 family glycosyltransferase